MTAGIRGGTLGRVVLPLSLLLLLLVLTGCETPEKIRIIRAPTDGYLFTGMEVKCAGASVELPAGLEEGFTEALERELYAEGGFVRGGRLELSFRFYPVPGKKPSDDEAEHEAEGDGGVEEGPAGPFEVKISYRSRSGKRLAHIEHATPIPGGPYGPATSKVVDRVARDVAKYTIVQFLRDEAIDPPKE